MTSLTTDFDIVEKLAIVQTVDSLILADGIVHSLEINALQRLMRRIDFDSNFILQARTIEPEKGRSIMRNMPYEKKEALKEILDEIAIADGLVHEKEKALISRIINAIDHVKGVRKAE
ncbi:TerB family tellurite resistance protein [Maribacter algicola]|uniref:TerB family tellurite resistance protein n=1 Tax=Meishania litoralis TaxID=3434685 RepID=A0ACC7LI44_9FLAO